MWTMRVWWLVVCACGRIDFDPRSDSLATGHDEDGDGIPDAITVSARARSGSGHSDRDGVGDACDPEPSMPRQRLSWFAPMADDTPCMFFPANAWTMTGDAWTVTGAMTGLVCRAFPVRDSDIWIGADITAVTGLPRQFALDIKNATEATYYYGDVYDDGFPVAAISQFDGASFNTLQSLPLPASTPVRSPITSQRAPLRQPVPRSSRSRSDGRASPTCSSV